MTARHTASLTLTMLALCSLAYGEDAGGAPAAGDDLGASEAHRGKAEQQAEGIYVQAMRAKEEGRMDDAVRLIGQALNLQPSSQKYRKASDELRAIAGVNRDARSVTIDRVADEFAAKQQQLWVEAQAKVDEGQRAMEAGEFDEAERAFQMASTRLETLPYQDERKEPELRRVLALRAEAQHRREVSEQELAADRNRQARDRQQELRDMSLRIERDRIDAMLSRAERARERRDFDEAILLCEQVLRINRAESRASSLLAKCRRERHVYLRQMTADRWDEEHKLLSEQIRTAMLPQLEIIKYAADWHEIDARRTAPTRGVGEDQNETWRQTINDQLEQEIHVEFQDTDLVDVVGFLQRVTSVNIVLDPAVIANAPPPVTLSVDKTKLRYVLDLIMKLTGLNYVMRDEAIFISNTEGVRGDVYMKLYDVRDLTHAMQSFPGPDLDIPEPGGQGARLLPPVEPDSRPETQEFIDIIQRVVSPNLWSREGVSIQEYQGAMVITQTADVHRQTEQLLRELRNQKGTQIHVKVKFLSVENSALEEIGVDWNNYSGPRNPANIAAGGRAQDLPGRNPATTSNTMGAYYGDQPNNIITAAALNNQLQPYETANSLRFLGVGTQGLRFQTQTWQLNSNWFVSAVLHAVEMEKRGNILFEPDLTMFNGQQGHIVHMNQQSYIADYDVVQGQYDPIITILSYGTVLDVQAIASADKKYITLTLRPTNAQVVRWRRFGPIITGNFPGGQVVGGGNTPGGTGGGAGGGVGGQPPRAAAPAVAGTNPLLVPELSYQSVRTSVTIPDGGSLIIAGMTNGESARSHSGVPFLSHIPFLGRLFSTNGRQETERRTMIIVQADVVLFEEIERNL